MERQVDWNEVDHALRSICSRVQMLVDGEEDLETTAEMIKQRVDKIRDLTGLRG